MPVSPFQPPKKSLWSYVLPILLIGAVGVLFLLLYSLFFSSPSGGDTTRPGAVVTIEQGEAKALLSGEKDFLSTPNGTKLFEEESIKTGLESLVSLQVLKSALVRLDANTLLDLSALEIDSSAENVDLTLQSGRAWVSLRRLINPDAHFTILAGRLRLESRGGEFSVEPNSIRVAKGSVSMTILDGTKEVSSAEVGVGQQFFLSDDLFSSLKKETGTLELAALSDDFKISPWFRRNMNDMETATSGSTVFGSPLSTTGTALLSSSQTGNTSTGSNTEEMSGTALPVPQILIPTTNGQTIKVAYADRLEVSGMVQKGVSGIEVNEYKLQKFQKGDTNWRYIAAAPDLIVGENLFTVKAIDENGKKSDGATVTILMEAKPQTSTGTVSFSGSTATVTTGSFAITEPNNGKDTVISATKVDIRGTTPSNTHKIVVNGYTLQGYTSGEATWRYIAAEKFGNLKAGNANTFTVTSYDIGGKKIGEKSIVITVQAAEFSAPAILQPSSSGAFETTATSIVISGTASVQSSKLWINGIVLGTYQSGDTTFQTTVSLTKGENTFKILAEDGAGTQSHPATIVITRK